MHGPGLLFVAAVAGYWVLERAETHGAGMLRGIGRFLGWFIILASVAAAAAQLSCSVCRPGMMGKGGMCPFSQARPALSAP